MGERSLPDCSGRLTSAAGHSSDNLIFSRRSRGSPTVVAQSRICRLGANSSPHRLDLCKPSLAEA